MRDINKELVLKKFGNISFHVLESMNDMVRVIDSKGHVMYLNGSMAMLLKEIEDNKIEKVKRSLENISKTTFLTGTTFFDEIQIANKTYSVKSSPVYDEDNKLILAVEVFRDITTQTAIRNELFKANKKMVDDIKFAKIIQTSILPKKQEFSDFLFDYRYEPSERLSGDIFDLIKIDNEKYAMYIADVVGHGVSSSIMTMYVRQTVRSIISEGKVYKPSDVLVELTKKFKELSLDSSQYFSIFYGVIDVDKKTLTYSNGGHDCMPIVFHKDGYSILKAKGKFISNVFDNEKYEEKKISINKGDELLLYTDGIVETKNANKEEFGIENLLDIDRENSNILGEILNRLNKFRWGEQIDDVALVYFKRKD